MSTLFSVRGKTAIVTGASYGLGVTFARVLADAGANLVLAARTQDKLDQVSAEICNQGGQALAIPCDVAEPSEVKELFVRACEHFGRVDVVVNNAGIAADAGIMPEKVTDELFLRTLQVNVSGLWCVCREAGTRMLADGKGAAKDGGEAFEWMRKAADLDDALAADGLGVMYANAEEWQRIRLKR